MRLLLRLLLLSSLLLTACGLSPADSFGEGEGEEAANDELGGDACDAGDCPPDESDSGPCHDLVTVTCGGGAECSEDPGCVAATLLSQYQEDGCASALTDPRSYPPCTASNCDELVNRVCGSDGSCASSTACTPAHQLQERANAGDVDATASCAAALTDETLFPACE